MATVPLINYIDIQNRFGKLLSLNGITDTGTLTDIANGAIEEITHRLGYNPQLDNGTTPALPVTTEVLDGGRPVIYLSALIDTTSTGAVLTVTELGQTLTLRTTLNSNPATGNYFIGTEGYALYRLNSPGGRNMGIWGANQFSVSGVGDLSGGSVLGGLRLGGDYTDSYRGCVTVTYTPKVSLNLLKQIALGLCRFGLIESFGLNYSVKDGDQSVTYSFGSNDPAGSKDALLARLPQMYLIGSGQ